MNDNNITDEILTMEEAGKILKLSKTQMYSLTRSRGQACSAIPFPSFKFHAKALRVKRSTLMQWVADISEAQRGTR